MAMISTELLRRHSYFSGAGEETLKKLAMIGEERSYHPGEVIFEEGDAANLLGVLTRGEVDLQTRLGSGEAKTVDTLVGGDLMCWSALVKPFRTHLSGVARRETTVIVIDARKLRDLIAEDPAFGLVLMTGVSVALSHRLEGAQAQLAAVT